MKRFLSFLLISPFLFIAASASAQVVVSDIPTAVAPPEVLEILPATTTPSVATSSVSTSTEVSTTTDSVDTQVVETIEIIPGSVSLKLTSPKPAVKATASESLTPIVTTEDQDGLFDLIYTGFEEFVFRVFGI